MTKKSKGRGRPPKSAVRDRMQQILDGLGVAYGYELWKVYKDAFEPVEVRTIYYHLGKGTNLCEFEEVGVKQEKGAYTWGELAEKKYYTLGPAASKSVTDDIHILIKTLNLEYRDPEKFIDWEKAFEARAIKLEAEYRALKERVERGEPRGVLEDFSKKLEELITWFGEKVETTRLIKLKNQVDEKLKEK